MTRRRRILMGMAAGMGWAVLVVWAGHLLALPVFALAPALAFAFLAPGAVYLVMIGRLAQRRFFDDAIIDGEPPAPGSAAEIDRRVLVNTTEQLVLALCLWPPIAWLLGASGPGVAVALGLNLALARLVFWAGYHLSPPARAFGFAASFYPTFVALAWAGLRWVLP